MAVARWLETDSLSNQNISSALAIGAYTADADRMIVCDVSLDQVAGGGDYVIYITRQINGAGSAYVLLPKTTCAAASGETAIAMQSGPITVRSGDVLTVMVDGLAGDTATPDTTVRWFEMATLRPATADRQLTVAATGEASANVTHHAGVAVAAADADGNVPVVLYPTQGAVTFGQVKILADINYEGALHIDNNALNGVGLFAHGTLIGQHNHGNRAGQYNEGGTYGQNNYGGGAGQYNEGDIPVVGAAQQEIADALKRAPAAGTPAVGSVYDLLGDVDANVDLLLAMDTSTTDATTAGAISRRRGNSWSIPLTIGAITGYTSLWLTIKHSRGGPDSDAILQVKLNASGVGDGLLYVNGTPASDSTKAAITVNNAATGAITITVHEVITAALPVGEFAYDIQTLVSGVVATPDSGAFTVTADVTRSIV